MTAAMTKARLALSRLALLGLPWHFLKMKHVFTFLILFVFSSLPAFAQDTVSVRSGIHDDYVRLVFDWQEPVDYSVAENESGVRVSFDAAASLAASSLGLANIDDISAVNAVAGEGGNLDVQIDTTARARSDFRHFKVGNRVIVDFMVKNSTVPQEPEPAPQQEPQAPQAAEPEEAEAPQEQDTKPVLDSKPSMTAAPAEAVEAVDLDNLGRENEDNLIMDSAATYQPHVITVSFTQSAGLAVFRRDDHLWIVIDRPNINVPPELEGPQRDQFAEFDRFIYETGTAYRLKLPEGSDFRIVGEGGGLVWRIVLSPSEKERDGAAEMERRFEGDALVRGGTAFWPVQFGTKIIDVKDPKVGDVIKTVTVRRAAQFSGKPYDFVDFAVLESPIGIAIEPKADTVEVTTTQEGVSVSRPEGLALSGENDIQRRKMRKDVKEAGLDAKNDSDIKTIFNFDSWMMGGLYALDENQRIVLSNAADKDDNGRAQDLIALAKVNLANDRGQEAIGFLDFAAQELPSIENSPQYLALRGAARAVAGKHELALDDLTGPRLADYTELDYWRAYTLAWLEDWQQAEETMPGDFSVLLSYPIELLEKLGIKLAEVALRNADVETAKGILAVLEQEREKLDDPVAAGLDYLSGEAARQTGDIENAREKWKKLTRSHDDFYRARAGLALTLLDFNTDEITADDAIDRLEGLRYAWRGDGLEAQINAELGELYLRTNRFLKGFTILRDAAAMTPGTDTGREITQMMSDKFYSLLMDDVDISPVDAVTVYEEFKELTPTGDEGNLLVQRLAERLTEADLLGRAAGILQHQVDFRLNGSEKARVAHRLAAIYLLDDRAGDAMQALDIAEAHYGNQDTSGARATMRDIKLLRARALSELNQTERAIALLNEFDPDPDVNRLRADIAWQAGMWDDAAEALHDLILDEGLDLGRPLTQEQADLILNRAVTLNLSGNRVALANMRERYGAAMKKTNRAEQFDVVTLPRKSMVFLDQETIDALVADVDIFQDFLESYKTRIVE